MKTRLLWSCTDWEVSKEKEKLFYCKFCIKIDHQWVVTNGNSVVKRAFVYLL